MIPRLIEKGVIDRLKLSNKIILLLGARQVGKTTLVQNIKSVLESQGQKVLYLNCDIMEEKSAINTTSRVVIENLTSNLDVLFIDEAQNLDNPGLTLKDIQAIRPQLKILATGSSGFELKNKTSDALTGRYLDFTLYPLSASEMLSVNNVSGNNALMQQSAVALLPTMLTFGFYPGVYTETAPAQKETQLLKIVESYLFKDILSFQRIRNSEVIKNLSKALAYQIGSVVNENELSKRLGVDRKTVAHYIDILEKTFVVIRVRPLSRNPRREIGRGYKVYFTDLGIRNALIGDFNPVDLRSDIGFLWENFLFIERMKVFANNARNLQAYFWRSYGGGEVDYIEEVAGNKTQAYEFKYKDDKTSRGAKLFSGEYNIPVEVINRDNMLKFLTL